MARGVLESLKRTHLDIKVGHMTPSTDGSLSWSASQDEMTLDKNNLVQYLKGIEISPDGKRLLFQITNVGVISVTL